MKVHRVRIVTLIVTLLLSTFSSVPLLQNPLTPLPAMASGYIDFEDGVDGQPIRSTIPGLEFTTTDNQDWIYGDRRTGQYNGKYPDGNYSSNANFFAWLGPSQGDGIITFTEGGATYLSVGVSTASDVTLSGYRTDGSLIRRKQFTGGNLDTGFTNELRIDTAGNDKFAYAVVSGEANYWLIDDLSTDAAGVPDSRTPLVFIPGIMGTRLNNVNGEVWPNWTELWDNDDDSLLVLRLAANGVDPLFSDNNEYNSVTVGDVIDNAGKDVYGSLETYLNGRGYNTESNTLYFFPYDWRKDNQYNADLLAAKIDQIKQETGSEKVNILAHSMGGLVGRLYISNPTLAQNVDTFVTLGTPYLGAPKAFDALHYGHACMTPFFGVCLLNRDTQQDMIQNSPGAYQLLPGPNYFNVYPGGHLIMDRDTDGDGQPEGWLRYSEVLAILNRDHNSQLVTGAESVFDKVDSYAEGTNGVNVYAFVGTGHDTPGSVREYVKRNWRGKESIAYDFMPTNGDETVPLHSADLGRNSRVHDYSGPVSYFYSPLKHGDLASFEEGHIVLQLAADILETGEEPTLPGTTDAAHRTTDTGNALLRSGKTFTAVGSATSPASDTVPVTKEPTPLSGYQFLIEGTAQLEIRDQAGNISRMNAEDLDESAIPGSSVYQIGDTISIFVPIDQHYTITVLGDNEDLADMVVRTIDKDELVQTVMYKDIPVQAATVGSLDFDPDTPAANELDLDSDGDGTSDMRLPPDTILDEEDSVDVTLPTLSINLDMAANGLSATLRISAADNSGGSGLMRVEYSLDSGATVREYAGPITINLSGVTVVESKAIDRAGNEAYATVDVAGSIYLPMIAR